MVINNIVIVGGGSSGWMTAAALAYQCPDIQLTLVESPKIGNVGVGESTLGQINRYMRMLDLKDQEWMKECSATYKTSIQFTDFKEIGHRFQYPFGFLKAYESNEKLRNMQDFFYVAMKYPKELPVDSFDKVHSLNTHMATHNKMWDEAIPEVGYDPEDDTAYHIDADAFGQYLKKRFCSKVRHIQDEVVGHQKDNDGNLEYITLEKGRVLRADLFIDCSGFKSLLIENTMMIPFEKFSILPNDSAVAARIPYKDEEDKRNKMSCVTDCKALSSGWLWDIPLWSRLGTGYVYSSEFQTKESAEEEFRQETGWDGDVRHIKFRHGKHKKAWEKNVVAIGLAYGFIEPLESTGLLTTHENIMKLIHMLKARNNRINGYDIKTFNTFCDNSITSMSEFVAAHYGYSLRDDTPYWRHVTTEIDYPHLTSETGPVYIAAGFGLPLKDFADMPKGVEVAKNEMLEHIKDLEYLVEQMPHHYDYLKQNIYK